MLSQRIDKRGQEQFSRRQCLEVVGILSSVDDKNLQSTVHSILGDIDVVCDQVILKIAIGSKEIEP